MCHSVAHREQLLTVNTAVGCGKRIWSEDSWIWDGQRSATNLGIRRIDKLPTQATPTEAWARRRFVGLELQACLPWRGLPSSQIGGWRPAGYPGLPIMRRQVPAQSTAQLSC